MKALFHKRYIYILLVILMGYLACSSLCTAATGALSYGTFQRLNKSKSSTSANNWLTLDFITEPTKEKFDSYFDMSMRFYYSADDFLYSVPQAYLNYKKKNREISFGRKVINWNSSEKFWLLNDLNPRQAFTLLGTKQEGLLGLHYDHNFNGPFFSIFMSYFYVPQVNPATKVKDGKVISKCEWVRLPPSKTVLEGRVVPIYYDAEIPKTEDVVFKKSLGLRFGYDWKTGNISTFALYKPENQLRINAEAYYDLRPDHVYVLARPVVNHHVIYGLDLMQEISIVRAKAGYKIIDPNARWGRDIDIMDPMALTKDNSKRTFYTDYFKIEPSYRRQNYLHASVSIEQPIFDISFNYLYSLNKDSKGSDDFYSETFMWRNALGMSFDYRLTDYFHFLWSLKYDLKFEDNIMTSEINYNIFEQLKLCLGVELLDSPDKESFWSAYRANDVVYSTLSYNF